MEAVGAGEHSNDPSGVAAPSDPGAASAEARRRALVELARLSESDPNFRLLAARVVSGLAQVLAAPLAVVGAIESPDGESSGAVGPAAGAPPVLAVVGLPDGAVTGFDETGRLCVTDPSTGGTLLAGPAAHVTFDRRGTAFVGVADRPERDWSVADRDHLELVAHLLSCTWARRSASVELESLQHHDALTGLPNRTATVQRIDSLRQRGVPVAVVTLGIDRFTVINDSLGRPAGDEVLTMLSVRLRRELAGAGVAGRSEGDRFVAVCEGVADQLEAAALAERLRRSLSTAVTVDGRELPITLTAGVAMAAAADTGAEQLRNAETAMYLAKGQGRAATLVYSPRQRDRALQRLETELALRAAIDDGDLVLHYQPVLDLRTGTTTYVEALVRWEHPERGTVSPADFVPLAEDTGLIVPLGAWVMEAACRQATAWSRLPASPRVRVAVNLSARQIAHSGLVEQVAATLDATGLDASRLILEITESALMGDAEAAMTVLRRLRALGVGLSIDDFGTGYSSLSYLKRFPVDTLKIDRAFIAGLGADPQDSAIVGATVRLADSLGLGTVAEGVETARQCEELLRLGCSQAQGFYFARPAPAAEIADYLGPASPPVGSGTLVAFPLRLGVQ